MFNKYVKTTLRNLAKNKLISGINILGLAISLTTFIFISLYINNELSYDKSHPDSERIYRIIEIIKSDNFVENSSSCPINTGSSLLLEFPEDIENQVRFFDFQNPIVTIQLDDKRLFNESNIYFTDTSVFDMMDFTLIQGDVNTVLTAPWTTVISQELAHKYFGDKNPIGEKITRVGFDTDFEITGIYTQNSISHIKTKMLHSFATVETFEWTKHQWVWNPVWTYIKLKQHVNPDHLEANKFPAFVQKYYNEDSRDMISHKLMPISDVHLKSHLEFEMAPNSDIKYIYIFTSCAIFLLIIAMVNFINLSTSHSLLRAKEIGVRKVIGATKYELIIQFLLESTIVAFISFILSLTLSAIAMHYLGNMIDLNLSLLFNIKTLAILISVVLCVGIASGVYPAFFISSFKPLVVLKGKIISQNSGQLMRKILVITQFTIAIVLIIFTYTTYSQLSLLNNKSYGFDAEKTIVLDVANTRITRSYDTFRNDLIANPAVENTTIMSDILAINNNNHEFKHQGKSANDYNYYPALIIDEEFVNTLGMKIIAGRDYSIKYSREDSLSVVVNKTMAKTLGYINPDDAIGQQLHSRRGTESIIGIVEDFNYKSLHSPIGPFVLDIKRNRQSERGFFTRYIALRVRDQSPATISHIEKVWKKHIPTIPFSYIALDSELKKSYAKENNMGSVLGTFAILTIMLACLGLFALATFIAQQKTKEIGIRKVMGATFSQLFYVGYKEQFLLILISCALAVPLGYYFIDKWLSDFAYRIMITPIPFIIAVISAIMISSLTVLSNFYKTIQCNPSDVLRDE